MHPPALPIPVAAAVTPPRPRPGIRVSDAAHHSVFSAAFTISENSVNQDRVSDMDYAVPIPQPQAP